MTEPRNRLGYRNGNIEREVTMENGLHRLRIPRGRINKEDGSTEEFRSEVLPRYARRTRRVDEAILGVYLAGGNTRRIRKALTPLLGEKNLSKSAISRVVGRLKAMFAEWSHRDLSSEPYKILYLDGFHLKVRMARRVISVPILVALGVAEDGSKRLLSLKLVVKESGASWYGFVNDLAKRGMTRPALLITDGHAGLKSAREAWDEVAVQRCTQHKLQNLLGHCPKARARRAAARLQNDCRRHRPRSCPEGLWRIREEVDVALSIRRNESHGSRIGSADLLPFPQAYVEEFANDKLD